MDHITRFGIQPPNGRIAGENLWKTERGDLEFFLQLLFLILRQNPVHRNQFVG